MERIIQVETLERAKNPIPTQDVFSIAKNLSNSDVLVTYDQKERLVNFKKHSFLKGMEQAYADHRPFVLSPDMIWLLICQGLSRHIRYNSEKLRNKLVDHQDKVSIDVQNNNLGHDHAREEWENVIEQLLEESSKKVTNEMQEFMTTRFSTTDKTSEIATKITMLSVLEPFFEYKVRRMICGIPEVTFQGTKDDWELILFKVQKLRKFDMDWWVDKIEPILEKLVATATGVDDVFFWQYMFKKHTLRGYGEPGIIDGWIIRFFPYDRKGQVQNFEFLESIDTLATDILEVPFKLFTTYQDGSKEEKDLIFSAGFVGLHQDEKTLTLKPEIGWWITEKGIPTIENNYASKSELVVANIEQIPDYIKDIQELAHLHLRFINNINVNDELDNLNLETLNLYGNISENDISRLKEKFCYLELKINKKVISEKPMNESQKAFIQEIKAEQKTKKRGFLQNIAHLFKGE